MISMEEARTRVAKGSAFLDARWPEWAEHVSTDRLNMADPCNCVLGQMTGDYNECLGKIWTQSFWSRMVNGEEDGPEELGFDAPDSAFELEKNVDFGRLQDAWIEAIADRRLSTAPNGTPVCDAVPVRPTVEVNVYSR